ncbi:hypothetical protein IAU60_005265 [Kwoniella sp. DSM 27419]
MVAVNARIQPAGPLRLRVAKGDEDLALLRRMRVECGWGGPKLEKNWVNPDCEFCLFQVPILHGDSVESGGYVELEYVGMACWLFQETDPTIADRETGLVHLASLYIRNEYQRLSLGTKALSLLEKVAVEKYAAKWCTLDTLAHHTSRDATNAYSIEHFDQPNKLLKWYGDKGYAQYKPAKPHFVGYPLPDNPDRLLTAVWLRKPADLVRAEHSL